MFKNIRAKHLLLIPAKIAADIIILVPMWYMLILGDLSRESYAALYFNFMCILFLVLITILIAATTILMTITILIALLYNLLVRKRMGDVRERSGTNGR
ncbi:MAG: hypothetical protein K2N85_01645 [Lachnospiraceae bacterium]|nr:hypothetical protein [Lachnospiraceae bacterium]